MLALLKELVWQMAPLRSGKILLIVAILALAVACISALWSVPSSCSPPPPIVTTAAAPVITAIPGTPCIYDLKLTGIPEKVATPQVHATLTVPLPREPVMGEPRVVLPVTVNDHNARFFLGEPIRVNDLPFTQELILDSGGAVTKNGVQIEIWLFLLDAETIDRAASLGTAFGRELTADILRKLLGQDAICLKVPFVRNK